MFGYLRSNITRAVALCGAVTALICAPCLATRSNAQNVWFIQTATFYNSTANYTLLQPADSNPNTIYFVTANWNPPSSGGVYNSHPTSVGFDKLHRDWGIINQDGAKMPAGASFNVWGQPYAADAYVHVATAANCMGDYTILDNPFTNNDPHALVWVTPNFNPGAAGGIYNNHNIGVWYNSQLHRWAIFNQDGSPISRGTAFNVTYNTGEFAPHYYVHMATPMNSTSDYTVIDNSLINGANGHIVMVTQNWNPPGSNWVYNNHPIGVWYNSALKKYAIFNQDGARIPDGAAFNVWVIK